MQEPAHAALTLVVPSAEAAAAASGSPVSPLGPDTNLSPTALSTPLSQELAVKFVLYSSVPDGPSDVMCKVLSATPGSPAEVDLRRELATAEAIRLAGPHSNIIDFYGSTVEASEDLVTACLYMRMGSTDLFEHLNGKGPQSESEARLMVKQIMQGLVELKVNVGMAHCDLKLENVVLVGGRLCLVDFGKSRPASEDVAVYAAGTPNYAAPETLAPDHMSATCNPCLADMWALGIMLVGMLTFQTPWNMAVLADARYRAWKQYSSNIGYAENFLFGGGSWPIPSKACLDFCCRLLSVNPLTRLSLEEAMLHPWLA